MNHIAFQHGHWDQRCYEQLLQQIGTPVPMHGAKWCTMDPRDHPACDTGTCCL